MSFASKVRHLSRFGVAFLTMLWLASTAVQAQSRSIERAVTVDIAPQKVSTALLQLSHQAEVQVLMPGLVGDQQQTKGVRGKMSVHEAVARLLEGTSLRFHVVGKDVIGIEPDASTSQSSPVEGPVRLSRNDVDSMQKIEAQSLSSDDSGASASVPAHKETSDQIEEIIVTAQKREERLQDVPVSISVLGGDELDKSTVPGITEALKSVPGVIATAGVQGEGTQLGVRGVTAHQPLVGGSSPIAYYIDGTPFGLVRGAVVPDPGAFDLERVEVLRGPQGTLYGANAMNGVVRVLTKDADLDELEFKARGSLSSTEDGGENYRGDVAMNVPIIPGRLAARAVLGVNDLSGWIDAPNMNKNDVNDAQLRNARLKVNWQPTEALSIGMSAWLARNDYGAPSLSDDDRSILSVRDQPITTDYDTYNLTVGYDLPLFSVTSMTSYFDYRNRGLLDLNHVAPNFTLNTEIVADMFTQEVYLASTGEGSWRWTLGGMYRDGKDLWNQTFQARRERSESFAIFGELTRSFLEGQLELTGGLRYFKDDVSLRETIPFNPAVLRPLIQSDETFDAVTPRVILTWHAADQLTMYGSYSEGFRSGAGQIPPVLFLAPGLPPAEPDTLRNYEVGVKGSLMDRRLVLEAALLYIDWQDVQLVLNIPFAGTNTNALVNGDSASGLGFEAAVTAEPVEGIRLGVNLNWNDLTVDSDVISAGAVLFERGDRLNLSSEYTVGAFADYAFPLNAGGFEGRLSASTHYHSPLESHFIQSGVGTVVQGDSILVARASMSIDAPKHWSATLFVDNLADEKGRVTDGGGTPFWHILPRPRTIGIQMDFRY